MAGPPIKQVLIYVFLKLLLTHLIFCNIYCTMLNRRQRQEPPMRARVYFAASQFPKPDFLLPGETPFAPKSVPKHVVTKKIGDVPGAVSLRRTRRPQIVAYLGDMPLSASLL